MKLFTVVSALVAVAAAQDLASLPPCAQLCINNMVGIASTEFKCAAGDIACYCREPRFALGLNDCSLQACGADVNKQVTSFGSAYCAANGGGAGGAGAAGAAGSAGSSIASGASSAISGAAASASSAISSVSGALASATASIASGASSAASRAASAASSATGAAGAAASSAASGAKSAGWAAPTQAPVIGAGLAGLAAMLLV